MHKKTQPIKIVQAQSPAAAPLNLKNSLQKSHSALMGCASSKRIDVAVDVYRPAPSSFAVFDATAIEEPWLKGAAADGHDSHDEKPSHLPASIVEKLNAIDDAPRSWDEVSKALEDIKQVSTAPVAEEIPPAVGRVFSFHTLEELEAQTTPKPTGTKKCVGSAEPELRRLQSAKTEVVNESGNGAMPKSVKDNIFIVKDRLERAKGGKPEGFVKRDPLSDFQEIVPPGGFDSVVLYTTSLGGVRRTYEDCNRVRQLMETHRVVFDERDVSLDARFLAELRELLGEGASVPRVFVKGRYIGGVEEVVGLNETGRLSRILNWARVERGVGRLGCGGCGGARFVPCLECGGSCKVSVGDEKKRCGECNENGLVHCPACI